MLNIDEVVKRLKTHKPTNLEEVMQDCKLPLKYVSNGAYRQVYQIVGTRSVIKIPRNPVKTEEIYNDKTHKWKTKYETSYDVTHANQEFQALQRMKRCKIRMAFLQPHLPEFYHFNQMTGISLVKKYNKVKYNTHIKTIDKIREGVARVFKIDNWDTDLHENNFGLDKDGTLKLIDLGCIYGG